MRRQPRGGPQRLVLARCHPRFLAGSPCRPLRSTFPTSSELVLQRDLMYALRSTHGHNLTTGDPYEKCLLAPGEELITSCLVRAVIKHLVQSATLLEQGGIFRRGRPLLSCDHEYCGAHTASLAVKQARTKSEKLSEVVYMDFPRGS